MRVFAKNNYIFNLLSEAVSEGILVVDRAQIIVATNNNANIMFGYKSDELIGQSVAILVPDPHNKDHARHVETFFDTHKSSGKMMVDRLLFGLRKNQEKFPVQIGLYPFSFEGIDYVFTLIFDKTEISKRDSQIKDLNDHLEKKIKTRTLELRETVAMLKKEIKKEKRQK